MRILFLSDIHGSLPALDAVLRYYDAHHYDLLVLLGDILNYGPRNGLCQGLDPQAIAERLNERAANIVAVRGNCDSEVDQMLLNFPIQSTYMLLVDEGKRFFITHGHVYNEKNMPTAPACDVFIMVTPIYKRCARPMLRLAPPLSSTRGRPHSPREAIPQPLPPMPKATSLFAPLMELR